MTNFDFLKSTPDFDAFSDVAISAEKILHTNGCWKIKVKIQKSLEKLETLKKSIDAKIFWITERNKNYENLFYGFSNR